MQTHVPSSRSTIGKKGRGIFLKKNFKSNTLSQFYGFWGEKNIKIKKATGLIF